jgi:hypothetical protein
VIGEHWSARSQELRDTFARFPDRFAWHSAPGVIYLIFLGTMLLIGIAGLSRGLARDARQPTR